ncbi:hypothetical protein [Nocardiopsis sp. LOL_012]|uniref:hypothetical protein n=1 Tax=Nocardiopsis sp. LOL_012 TaxID=3345409 RepID=UPI003A89AEB8
MEQQCPERGLACSEAAGTGLGRILVIAKFGLFPEFHENRVSRFFGPHNTFRVTATIASKEIKKILDTLVLHDEAPHE